MGSYDFNLRGSYSVLDDLIPYEMMMMVMICGDFFDNYADT